MITRLFAKSLLALFSLAIVLSVNTASAESIFLTGHDPDFHAALPNGTLDSQGAVNIHSIRFLTSDYTVPAAIFQIKK